MKNINTKISIAKRFVAFFVVLTFLFTSILLPVPSVKAQSTALPVPGTIVTQSVVYQPILMKGIKIFPKDPLRFDFIMDQGDANNDPEELEVQSTRLIKYFLTSLTIPEQDLWVNLSPYEKNRIIPETFGFTEMGRDMLSQDYLLKQLTASMVYPDSKLGEEFWKRIFKKSQERYGHTNIPLDSFHKVWILPEKAQVYQNEDVAFVVDSHLKVMLESDYLALSKNKDKYTDQKTSAVNNLSTEIIRDLVIPEIEREVNEGAHFAQLRQIYHSLILATWFKRNLQKSLLGEVYIGKNLVDGVSTKEKNEKERIYHQYVEAFKQGVYNYIREDYDPYQEKVIPRKYFSGGIGVESVDQVMDFAMTAKVEDIKKPLIVRANIEANTADQAMASSKYQRNMRVNSKQKEIADYLNQTGMTKRELTVNMQGYDKKDIVINGISDIHVLQDMLDIFFASKSARLVFAGGGFGEEILDLIESAAARNFKIKVADGVIIHNKKGVQELRQSLKEGKHIRELVTISETQIILNLIRQMIKGKPLKQQKFRGSYVVLDGGDLRSLNPREGFQRYQRFLEKEMSEPKGRVPNRIVYASRSSLSGVHARGVFEALFHETLNEHNITANAYVRPHKMTGSKVDTSDLIKQLWNIALDMQAGHMLLLQDGESQNLSSIGNDIWIAATEGFKRMKVEERLQLQQYLIEQFQTRTLLTHADAVENLPDVVGEFMHTVALDQWQAKRRNAYFLSVSEDQEHQKEDVTNVFETAVVDDQDRENVSQFIENLQQNLSFHFQEIPNSISEFKRVIDKFFEEHQYLALDFKMDPTLYTELFQNYENLSEEDVALQLNKDLIFLLTLVKEVSYMSFVDLTQTLNDANLSRMKLNSYTQRIKLVSDKDAPFIFEFEDDVLLVNYFYYLRNQSEWRKAVQKFLLVYRLMLKHLRKLAAIKPDDDGKLFLSSAQFLGHHHFDPRVVPEGLKEKLHSQLQRVAAERIADIVMYYELPREQMMAQRSEMLIHWLKEHPDEDHTLAMAAHFAIARETGVDISPQMRELATFVVYGDLSVDSIDFISLVDEFGKFFRSIEMRKDLKVKKMTRDQFQKEYPFEGSFYHYPGHLVVQKGIEKSKYRLQATRVYAKTFSRVFRYIEDLPHEFERARALLERHRVQAPEAVEGMVASLFEFLGSTNPEERVRDVFEKEGVFNKEKYIGGQANYRKSEAKLPKTMVREIMEYFKNTGKPFAGFTFLAIPGDDRVLFEIFDPDSEQNTKGGNQDINQLMRGLLVQSGDDLSIMFQSPYALNDDRDMAANFLREHGFVLRKGMSADERKKHKDQITQALFKNETREFAKLFYKGLQQVRSQPWKQVWASSISQMSGPEDGHLLQELAQSRLDERYIFPQNLNPDFVPMSFNDVIVLLLAKYQYFKVMREQEVLSRHAQRELDSAQDFIRKVEESQEVIDQMLEIFYLDRAMVADTMTMNDGSLNKVHKKGGIDFDPQYLDIETSGRVLSYEVEELESFQNMNISGFTPNIIFIQPVLNLPLLLGLTNSPEDENRETTLLSKNIPFDRKVYP